MKLENYTQNAIEGPFQPTRPTKADLVILWLSGFVAGLVFALLITGN
jgi:LPS O-antigen subunit length determinant protein (WzzB/FepE family)